MSSVRRLLGLILMLSLLFATVMAEPVTFTDALDREITVDSRPQTVAVLLGSFAESWLLSGGELTAVTSDAFDEVRIPADTDVQTVGTSSKPSVELVLALQPDLVILSAEQPTHTAMLETLEAAGVKCAFFSVMTVEEYIDLITVFCRINGRMDLLDVQKEQVETPVRELIEAARKHEDFGKKTVLLLRCASIHVKARNADNMVGAMLRDIGLINIADRDGALLENLSLEQIVTEDPDFIFYTVMGSDHEKAMNTFENTLTDNPAWQALTAVREGRVYELPKDLFQYKPNSRWAEAYRMIWEIVYGDE